MVMGSRRERRFITSGAFSVTGRSLAVLSVPACLLLGVPFMALVGETPWQSFDLAYGDWAAVRVSIGLGGLSMVLIFVLGVPLALWLARSASAIKPCVEALVLAALLTPPLAMGILLVSAYGPYSTVGQALSGIGIVLSNNAGAFILAQVYGGIGYFVLSARAAFEAVPPVLEEAAEGLGAGRWTTFRLLTLPLARRGLIAGLITAWARAIGEFGIVMVFAYFPQGMPVKLFVNLQDSGVDAVYALLWLLLLVTLPMPLFTLLAFRQRGH